MSAFITGAAGFVGQWLVRALLAGGERVSGLVIGDVPSSGVLTAEEIAAVDWVRGDVTNSADLFAALDSSRPSHVYHLAGISYLAEADSDPIGTFEINTLGAGRLVSAVAAISPKTEAKPRVLVVGSAEQYGSHARTEPLREEFPQRPITVYGASKVAQEVVALASGMALGVDVVATRSFNHSGPGQSSRFLLPALIGRVRAMEASGSTALALGNLTPVRDFLHVADVVSAYIALLRDGIRGEVYNVCSGRGVNVAELAGLVLQRSGVHGEVVSDPRSARPVDLEWTVGDNAKLKRATGWNPTRSVEDIVDDLWAAPAYR